MIILEEAIAIVQQILDQQNLLHQNTNGKELLVVRSRVADLGYGWYVPYHNRGTIEDWIDGKVYDLAGGAPYIVERGQGDWWRLPGGYFGIWWQLVFQMEIEILGVIRVSNVVHPTLLYTGEIDMSYLPAFNMLKDNLFHSRGIREILQVHSRGFVSET